MSEREARLYRRAKAAEARAEAAEQQYENLLRAGQDQTDAFDRCRATLAAVREWAEQNRSHFPEQTLGPGDAILAILDEEGEK